MSAAGKGSRRERAVRHCGVDKTALQHTRRYARSKKESKSWTGEWFAWLDRSLWPLLLSETINNNNNKNNKTKPSLFCLHGAALRSKSKSIARRGHGTDSCSGRTRRSLRLRMLQRTPSELLDRLRAGERGCIASLLARAISQS